MMFWWIAGVMVLLALGIVVPPLFRSRTEGAVRDELNVALFRDRLAELEAELAAEVVSPEQYEQARHELERDLLVNVGPGEEAGGKSYSSGRWAALLVVLLVPALSFWLYLRLGVADLATGEAVVAHDRQGGAAGNMAAAIEQLQKRLEAEPNDVEGWVLMGRSLVAMERYDAAAQALANAYSLAQEQPDVITEYAEVLALAKGGDFSGRPTELLERALALDPALDQALWLAGVAALQRQDFDKSVAHWSRLLELLPADGEATAIVQANLERARKMGAERTAARTDGGRVPVRVELAPALAAKTTPEDVLFVFARASEGPPMPIAAVRHSVGELPLSVVFNDESSQAMGSGRRLSEFEHVTIVARISKTGQPTPTPGDLEGTGVAKVGASEPITVVIDRVLP